MSEPIVPALTAEEWDRLRIPPPYTVTLGQSSPMDLAISADGSRHALAALALYGQPFGFTREDVRILRVAAEAYDQDPFYFRDLEPAEDVDESPVPRMYRALADRIDALLPPEK